MPPSESRTLHPEVWLGSHGQRQGEGSLDDTVTGINWQRPSIQETKVLIDTGLQSFP